MNKYINREISWLKFNARVLQEAQNEKVPLLERLRFLGIYSNNLDEFYKVRYASLVRAINIESSLFYNIVKNQTAEDLLEQINKVVFYQQKIYDALYTELIEDLKKENIYFVDDKTIKDEHKEYVREYFNEKLSHTIVVLFWKEGDKTPALKDGAFYLVVKLTLSRNKKSYALIEVPTNIFSRFIVLPSIGGTNYFMYLEDVIRLHLKDIFSIFRYSKVEAHSIKITRDAELSIDNDVQISFLQSISESVEGRKKGQPVRLVYDKSISEDTLDFMISMLEIDDYDNLTPGGKYHNKRDFMSFPNFGRNDLEYEKIKPLIPSDVVNQSNYFKLFSKKEVLLYAPYHDYSILLKFLRKAAIDPYVKKIKITVYRVADDSQVMSALINAAKNGKEVTAALELRARFDEAHNVKWSKTLQKEGVKVIFGVPGLKVHSKICYIEREPQFGFSTQYCFVSTGNFHEKTARVYTDFTLFTSDKEITNEVKEVFDFFDKNYLVKKYDNLVLSPWQQRKKIIKLIHNEVKNHKKGLPAQINIKVNSLSDKEIIDELYNASRKGVEIRIVVRGICSLIPQVKGMSENITVVSVIDKFLEHPRMYWFKNAGDDLIYISSADLMPRNLDHRIETSCPIRSHKHKIQIKKIFELSFYDNIKGREVVEGLEEPYQKNKRKKYRSQIEVYNYLKGK
ncbi:MAG: polyphosphate kinase 1 [Flavobacteriales bacterium]|nr:polyphosphate kinase 1 [Flavobacteriales bacterium]